MSTKYKSASISVEEILDSVGAEFDDVTGAVRVSDEVWLDAQILIAVCRVWPKNVNDELLFRGGHFMNDL